MGKNKKLKKQMQGIDSDSDEEGDVEVNTGAPLDAEKSKSTESKVAAEPVEKPLNTDENSDNDNELDDRKKKKKVSKSATAKKEEAAEDDDQTVGTVKSAAQKKKEKKERDKQKRLATKQTSQVEIPSESTNEDPILEDNITETGENADNDSKKKKKKKAAVTKDEEKEAKKGPGKKTIAAMQDALKKLKEEEERIRREQEEQERREDEAETARLEAIRLEQERKDKKKRKEKERKERLKAEGKLLTSKQKTDRVRAQALIDSLKAQGLELPDVGERKHRPGTRVKTNKSLKQQTSVDKSEPSDIPAGSDDLTKSNEDLQTVDSSEIAAAGEVVQNNVPEIEDDIKDTWDADSSEEETSEPLKETKKSKTRRKSSQYDDDSQSDSNASDDDDEDNSDDSGSASDDSSSDVSEVDSRTDAQRRFEKAKGRIAQRRLDAEKHMTIENLRAAVVCVLGHVDTGKTKILDKLRRTNVQDGEAGGITQQIGATNVPIDAIKEQIKIVKGASDMEMKIPGLLIIDTPGHESFSNLRSRGSSLCDIAILVVDIMHGLEPQTIESLNLLKGKKTPFVVALNKIDRLYDWETMNRKDVRDIIKNQASNTQMEFEQRSKEVVVQFAEQGLNAALFYENPDPKTYVSLIPTSAVTGEGMGNLLALIVDACQTRLAKRLMYSDELQATVLEVKALPGLGTTIDVILVNGTLREGDSMLLAGTDGPIVTQIRSLLMPEPMRELRVKNAYVEYKEIKAAQGVKIAAKELEKAIAGLNLFVAHQPDEVDVVKEEVARELKTALSNIKLQERGVYVQASTLGSLEALLEFLKTSKIPYSNIRIGPVVKRDVTKASTMLEHESQYATILAFDVKIERDAQELADNLGVKIFQADIIYHLFDKFIAYRDELKQKKRDEFKHIAVFPCKLKILPQFVFNSRDPIVAGVMVEAGIVREGTPICVPTKEFVELGFVSSIECNHKNVESARKGMEVCIKIEPIPGESPKMFGRHFDETDFLVSKISRQSIDACKNYFRDDLLKSDWQLMVDLKKTFEIL